MKTFTIEDETNNILIHATAQEAEAVANAGRFHNEAGLAKLATDWPAARLVDIWNSLPGVTPVNKFKDRPTAIGRIWKALQRLGEAAPVADEATPVPEAADTELPETALVPEQEARETTQPEAAVTETAESVVASPVAPQAPHVAPDEPAAPRVCPACGRALPKPKKARSAANRTAGQQGPRESSKTSQVIELLKREGGVTLEELMAKFQWQKHTTRSMLSAGGPLIKKHGLVITSEKVGDKRTYSIKA